MARKWQTLLWLLAGLTAAALLTVTLRLAARARNQAMVNTTVYLMDVAGAVGLHERPDPTSRMVAALARGSAVTIVEVTTEQGRTWVRVKKGNTMPGWIPLEAVTRDPP